MLRTLAALVLVLTSGVAQARPNTTLNISRGLRHDRRRPQRFQTLHTQLVAKVHTSR